MRRIDSVLREAGGQLSLLPQEHHRSSVASAPKALAPGEEIGSQLSLAECFEGGFNAFALGVARRATSQPERVPLLLLYGPPAVGKSRILQSVGHDLTAAGRKVLAVTAEGLMHEFVDSVRFDRMPRFRERYRGADTLLVDELAALETTQRRNPEKTQLELAQTVRALMLGGGKQIVFASAKPVIGRTDAGPRFLCFPEALGGVLVGALQVPLRTPIESEVAAFAKW
ncbi:MAG TPA: DnaA/Hda family protein, partial [Candidatus Paceibacterota bacterium]|nr:DnaA/Hda family protein [Candidatus Paceibacterota bacterium]